MRFDAGGHDNADLPAESRYRSVTPVAFTIANGSATPWRIEYETFDDATHNGHYQ